MITARGRDLPYVTATLNYAGDIKGRARVDALNPTRNNFSLASQQARIFDATSIAMDLDLDVEGFACFQQKSRVLHNKSVDQIVREQEDLERNYHGELVNALRAITGADRILPHRFGLTVRVSEGEGQATGIPKTKRPVSQKTGMPLVYDPAQMAHADYTAKAFHEHVGWLHQREGEALRSFSRAALYHMWRPLTPPPHDMPLAINDGRTARKDGHVVMDAVAGPEDVDGNAFETRIAAYSPHIDWYYFPQMTPDNLIVFKGFDTAREEQTVFHSAFANPQTGATLNPRASIEARVFAFWD